MEQEDKDFALFEELSSIGINPQFRQYNIIEELKFLFQFNDKDYFTYCFSNDRIFTNEDINSFSVGQVVKYLLIKTVSLKNKDALLIIKEKKHNNDLMFYGLIRFTALLHGTYLLMNQATQSEFWYCVNNGQIDDSLFLSFHSLHYLHHQEKSLSNDVIGITNITKQSHLYQHHLIEESRHFAFSLMQSLEDFWLAGFFDENLLNFNQRLQSLLNGKSFYHLLEKAFDTTFNSPPLFLARLEYLIN